MILILLVTIGGILASLIFGIANRDFNDFIFGILLGILGFVLIGAIVGGISLSMPESTMNIELAFNQPIIALKDGKGLVGRFYLYSGYVKDDLYYYYARETDRGYKVEKVKASACYIVYTDENPHIEKYAAKSFKNWTSWIYAVPLHDHYILYVPDGTITTDFSINLE